jgi:thioredoxin reductase
MDFDVVIVGGGPAGLSGALALGRARRRVLLLDSGPRRNAAAIHLHNFVTQDGVSPDSFRELARGQLRAYPNVEVQDARALAITGVKDHFQIELAGARVGSRRVLLCTGMIDEMLPIPGFEGLWGHSIFQCPYCHGWEVADRAWGYLVRADHAAHMVRFATQARGWSRDVTVFFDRVFEPPQEAAASLDAVGVRIERSPVRRLHGREGQLVSVELEDGRQVACDALFAHPPQRQVELVNGLGLELDEGGEVQVDERRETSIPGIFAAGDLATKTQGAILASAAAVHAAAAMNVELTATLARSGMI